MRDVLRERFKPWHKYKKRPDRPEGGEERNVTAGLGLTLMTNVIVQVLKGLLYDRIPTNLLAFLTAAVVTAGTGFALWSYYGFSITGWMIAGLIGLCFLVAFAAMYGYDKLVQMVEQAGWLKSGEKKA